MIWEFFNEIHESIYWEDELFDEIQRGDNVCYENPQGQTHYARAIMRVPHGWVCDRGNGQTIVVNEGDNYLGHTKVKEMT